MTMRKTVDIKFKPDGKAYVFDCGAFVLETGDYVIVETEQGYGMGVVASTPAPVNPERIKTPLKKVHRKAIDKALGRLEQMSDLIPMKNWQTAAHGGVRRTVRESLFRLEYKKVE